jgi:nitrogen fixation NifU-like protein
MDDSVYQRSIMDLARARHGAGPLQGAQASATADNPVCGDRVTVELSMEGVRVAALGHTVRGCMLCEATASVIGRNAPGASADDLARVRAAFEAMIREGGPAPETWPELAAFEPVRTVRSRHECVLLPFAALAEALDQAAKA